MSEVVSKDIAAPVLTQYFYLLSARQKYSKQHYIDNKDKIKAYGAIHHAQYYAANKEQICANTRQYYRDNVDSISEKKVC